MAFFCSSGRNEISSTFKSRKSAPVSLLAANQAPQILQTLAGFRLAAGHGSIHGDLHMLDAAFFIVLAAFDFFGNHQMPGGAF